MRSQNKPQKPSLCLIISNIGIIFFLIGLFYQIPDREIPYNYQEYVGGDAYNIMIEASIRGGEIAGATVAKAIYIVFGFSLLLLSTFLRMRNKTNAISLQDETEIKDNIVENEAKSSEIIS